MLFAQEGAKLTFEGGSAAVSTLITFLLGIGIVFVGLIALILIVKLMGAIMSKVNAKKAAPVPEPQKAEPVKEGDRGEIIAAVSAAIATVMGENVGGIRIVSFKKVD
jgi:sodium pump decarboxylase gamma subunit